LVGTEKSNILAAMHEALKEKKKLPPVSPIGDGTAATKTVEVIKKDFF
jgi:UDP-N-acetylglucosamine 2-epimerase